MTHSYDEHVTSDLSPADFPVSVSSPPRETAGSAPQAVNDSPVSTEQTQRPRGQVALDGLPPKPKTARFNTLDSVRGIACLMLVFYHAAFYADYSWQSSDPSTWTVGGFAISLVSRLWMGVPMFFVVSGYCITASVDSLRRRPHSLSDYFYRRFRRIYPPLWAGFAFAIVVTLLVGLASTSVFESCKQLPRVASFTAADWIGNFAAATSWLPKLSGGESNYLLLNTWTLCYEEQFYVVTGLLLLCSPRRFFLLAYIVAGVTIAVRHGCRTAGVPTNGFFFDGHWLMFAAGILLYQRINYLTGRTAWMAIMALGMAAAYGLGERLLTIDPHDKHMGEYIFVAATFAIFLSVIKRWDDSIANHWSLAPFRWCGKISYSIYLTHFPITVLAACLIGMLGIHHDGHVFLITIPICLALSLPLSWIFYQLVERHFVNAPSK